MISNLSTKVAAHQSALALLSTDSAGTVVASASEAGTVVKVASFTVRRNLCTAQYTVYERMPPSAASSLANNFGRLDSSVSQLFLFLIILFLCFSRSHLQRVATKQIEPFKNINNSAQSYVHFL